MCISNCLWSISCSIAFSRASNAARICLTSASLTAADSSWSSWAFSGLWVQRNVVSMENEMGQRTGRVYLFASVISSARASDHVENSAGVMETWARERSRTAQRRRRCQRSRRVGGHRVGGQAYL